MTAREKGKEFFKTVNDDVYNLGEGYRRAFAAAAAFLYKITIKPLVGLLLLVVSFLVKGARYALYCFTRAAEEGRQFFGEVKRAIPGISAKFHEKPSAGIRRFFSCVGRAFVLHKHFNRAVASTVVPIVALALLTVTANAIGGLTFAVDVTLNGVKVGTVRDESVYREAEQEAVRRFRSVGSDVSVTPPQYSISVTSLNGLDNKETVCDGIIAALSDKTVTACGVYVDGEFLCAVDGEDTYNRVSETVLKEYAGAAKYVTDDVKITFNAEITALTGLYPENEKIWTADELYDYMSGYKVENTEHTVGEDEALEDILSRYSITEAELETLNPDLDIDNIPQGSVLLIKKGERNLSVKIAVTYLENEIIPYSTVKQYDNNLYVGNTMTVVAGSSGQDVVSYTDTYVDNELVDSKRELVRYNAKSAVNELLKIGTRGVPVENSGIPVSPRLLKDQGGTFIWPAPDNCFWLSQGYNPANGHRGIDIVSSDNGSCRGRRIVAVADGVVVMATYHYSWGYYIRVDHGSGVVTGYAHALEGSFRVNVGDYVRAGQQLSSIGTTGNSSGYHLHFEVWLDGTRVNPLPYVYSTTYGISS